MFIISASRTPMGKFLGGLSSIPASRLCSFTIKDAIKKAGIKPGDIEEVILGNVLQAGEGQNPARQAAIFGGIPYKIPSTTINMVCGSGLKSVIMGVQSIQSGDADVVLAGGTESMSNAPHILMGSRKIKKYGSITKRELMKSGTFTLLDSMIHEGLRCSFNSCHMGNLAENAARKFNISRREQDVFSLESHKRAIRAQDSDKFKKEIIPVKANGKTIRNDEGPRRDTNLKKISELNMVFEKKGTITAGNASQLSDGASALVIASEAYVKKTGVKPLARIDSYAQAAGDPAWYTTSPVDAVRSLLRKTGRDLDDFDLIELNEAYAVQSLAVIKELNISKNKLNVNGGAIALGHPIGCTGARILTTLIHAMHDRKKDVGLATLCIGGGQSIALCVERV